MWRRLRCAPALPGRIDPLFNQAGTNTRAIVYMATLPLGRQCSLHDRDGDQNAYIGRG
jgi:hypothetical protein